MILNRLIKKNFFENRSKCENILISKRTNKKKKRKLIDISWLLPQYFQLARMLVVWILDLFQTFLKEFIIFLYYLEFIKFLGWTWSFARLVLKRKFSALLIKSRRVDDDTNSFLYSNSTDNDWFVSTSLVKWYLDLFYLQWNSWI